MKTKRNLSLALIFLMTIFSFTLPYKVNATENDFGNWDTIYLNVPVTEKFKFSTEVGWRFQDDLPNNFLVRPSIGYEFLDGLTGWFGYGYFDYDSLGNILENRMWQQIQYSKELPKLWNTWLTTRFRLEERWFTETDIDDFSMRGRYLLRLMYPLTQSKKWFFVLSDDVLFNFNDALGGIESDGYSQNRFFTGLNFKPTENLSLEVGYQLQHLNFPKRLLTFFGPIHFPDFLNHGVVVNLYLQVPQLFGKKGPAKFYLPPL